MGLFDFFKKSSGQKKILQTTLDNPYKDSTTNLIYNLLFCDSLELYKTNTQTPYTYPFNILFSETSSITDLQRIIDEPDIDPRIKVLAYNKQLANGYKPNKKEILAVIVEVGLDGGLDVLASFNNGTSRYINQTGKVLVCDTTIDTNANAMTSDLFSKSQQIVNQIGTGNNARRPHPLRGNARITFLVSDGLSFGEAPIKLLFSDQLASPALAAATRLMQYLTEKSLEKNSNH